MNYRIATTSGHAIESKRGTNKQELVKAVRRAGFVVTKAWDDGCIPFYRSVGDARRDANDGSHAFGLIRPVMAHYGES